MAKRESSPGGEGRSIWLTTWTAVGALVALLAIVSTVTIIGRASVTDALDELNNRVLPAQDAATALSKSFVDQETGQRGYLLTGDPRFLAPYQAGRESAARLMSQLATLLATDGQARHDLATASSAGDAWQNRAAEPEIAARRQGVIPQARLDGFAANGKPLFDTLRQQLAALQSRATQLSDAALRRISTAQQTGNIVTVIALGLAVIGVVAFVPMLRRRLTRPMTRLVQQVQQVAEGSYDGPIDVKGPREVATVARAVGTMRDNLVNSTQELVSAQHELTLRTEQARVASELRTVTSQRVFALGLALTSAATRSARSLDLQPFITETDNILRDLRTIAFDLEETGSAGGLRSDVGRAVEDKAAALGFQPTLEFAGPVDAFAEQPAHAELIRLLGEALDAIARTGTTTRVIVGVTATHDRLTLTVADPATTEPRTTVDWYVPADTDSATG